VLNLIGDVGENFTVRATDINGSFSHEFTSENAFVNLVVLKGVPPGILRLQLLVNLAENSVFASVINLTRVFEVVGNVPLKCDVFLTILPVGQAVDRFVNELHLYSRENDVLHVVKQAGG